MNIRRFSDLCASAAVRGQRVFIRADLNVPQDETGRITEDTRIRASVPCIEMALKAGAAVMVTSHLGRPTEGQFKPEDSLAPVALRLAELLGRPVPLRSQWIDGVQVAPGEVVLLENCRRRSCAPAGPPPAPASPAAADRFPPACAWSVPARPAGSDRPRVPRSPSPCPPPRPTASTVW